jgi:hypothetical protein
MVWSRRTGLTSRQGQEFTVFHSVQTGCGAHPASHPVDTGSDFPRAKRSGREAAQLPPTSIEVKNGGAVLPLPHMSSWYKPWRPLGLREVEAPTFSGIRLKDDKINAEFQNESNCYQYTQIM